MGVKREDPIELQNLKKQLKEDKNNRESVLDKKTEENKDKAKSESEQIAIEAKKMEKLETLEEEEEKLK